MTADEMFKATGYAKFDVWPVGVGDIEYIKHDNEGNVRRITVTQNRNVYAEYQTRYRMRWQDAPFLFPEEVKACAKLIEEMETEEKKQ